MGSPISAVGGFLDDSLYDRVGWILDHKWINKMMVYNDHAIFAVGQRPSQTLWHRNLFRVGESEYKIFAFQRTDRKTTDPSGNQIALETPWETPVPLRVAALTLTGKTLFFAGTPLSTDPDQLLQSIRGKKGAVLWTVDPSRGNRLSKIGLEAPPVWDGMAAARGRLFVAMTDGRIVCLGKDR